MKIIFFGTPQASAIVLEKLIAGGHTPIAVVTNPDRPAGRKHVITPPPVKQFIAEHKLPITIFQPEKLAEIKEELAAFAPDIFIVAFYGKLIPKSILEISKHGALGVHPSLLPLYRGPSPIQTAILEGASEVGVSLYVMDEKMDEGPLVGQEKLITYRTGEKNNIELWHELAAVGGEMAARLLPAIIDGSRKPMPQTQDRATYTKKFSTEDAFINNNSLKIAQSGTDPELAKKLHQKILAFTPEPGAWTTENGKRLKLLQSKIAEGKLVLTLVQREGRLPEAPTQPSAR